MKKTSVCLGLLLSPLCLQMDMGLLEASVGSSVIVAAPSSARVNLVCAIEKGDLDLVKDLIGRGADVSARDLKTYKTPLEQAVCLLEEQGDAKAKDFFQVLLQQGAHANPRVFQRVCEMGAIESVKVFLQSEGSLLEDTWGQSPFLIAYEQGNDRLLRILVQSAKESGVGSLLRLRSDLARICEGGSYEMIQALLEGGIPLEDKDLGGYLFMETCWRDNLEGVRAFIDAGIDLNQEYWCGRTPLMLACGDENSGLVAYLLDKGARINQQNRYGETALFSAVDEEENEAIVSLLLKAGADLEIKDQWGRTAIYAAMHEIDSLRILLQAGAKLEVKDMHGTTPFLAAMESSNPNVVRLFLDLTQDWRQKDDLGHSAFTYLSSTDHTEIAETFLAKGFDINVQGEDGYTPLLVAVECEAEKMVRFLLEKGADVHARMPDGKTAMHLAAIEGASSLILLLQKAGLLLDEVDSCGATPLMLAVQHRKEECVQELLERGARRDIRTTDSLLLENISEMDESKTFKEAPAHITALELAQLLQSQGEEMGVILDLLDL